MRIFDVASSVVSAAWLNEHLSNSRVVILDASFGATCSDCIPGARKFDIDKSICDRESPLPHMMPSAKSFELAVRRMGICRDSVIIVYDAKGIYSSPRGRMMFKATGHEKVAILDGGFPAWCDAGYSIAKAHSEASRTGDYEARPVSGIFCDASVVESALRSSHSVVIDARSPGRFLGLEPEPREGLRLGHMPGAMNLPYGEVLMGGRMKSRALLESLLGGLASKEKRLIFSCGSGVTACIPALAAELAGYERISVYDGSWSEWGLPSERLVTT